MCERNSRACIVDDINRYFAKFDEMLDVAKRYGDAEISTVKDLWGELPRNRAINAALPRGRNGSGPTDQEPISAGATPMAMKSMLGQYNGTTDNCPRA